MAIDVKPNKWQHFGWSANQSFSKNSLSNQRLKEYEETERMASIRLNNLKCS